MGEMSVKRTGGRHYNLHALFTEPENLTRKTKVHTRLTKAVRFG